jgi:hypothetical protein
MVGYDGSQRPAPPGIGPPPGRGGVGVALKRLAAVGVGLERAVAPAEPAPLPPRRTAARHCQGDYHTREQESLASLHVMHGPTCVKSATVQRAVPERCDATPPENVKAAALLALRGGVPPPVAKSSGSVRSWDTW